MNKKSFFPRKPLMWQEITFTKKKKAKSSSFSDWYHFQKNIKRDYKRDNVSTYSEIIRIIIIEASHKCIITRN